jgi:hypothetical protein
LLTVLVVRFLYAVLVRCSDDGRCTTEAERAVDEPRAPTFREHDGHAPQPCDASTRSATAICWARLAVDGLPCPPCARQVDWVNCRPPEYPLPVLVFQFPPLSHCAIASHWESDAAFAVPASATGAPATTTPVITTRATFRALMIRARELPRDRVMTVSALRMQGSTSGSGRSPSPENQSSVDVSTLKLFS